MNFRQLLRDYNRHLQQLTLPVQRQTAPVNQSLFGTGDDVDANTMPAVFQQSSDVPDADIGLRLRVVRSVRRLDGEFDALAGPRGRRQRHRRLPDRPRPLATVRLRHAVLQPSRPPRETAVHGHIDALDAPSASAHCVAADSQLGVVHVDRSTVNWTAYCRLHRKFLDGHHLYACAYFSIDDTGNTNRVSAAVNKYIHSASRHHLTVPPRYQLSSTLYNPHHTLHVLLPPQSTTSQNYQLRQRVHDRQLPEHIGHLIDKIFITRSLYKDMYWLLLLCNLVLCG